MKRDRSPILSRTRIGYPPLLVTLVVGCGASVMDLLGGYSDRLITFSAVVLTVAIALWSQIIGHRRTARLEKRLSQIASD